MKHKSVCINFTRQKLSYEFVPNANSRRWSTFKDLKSQHYESKLTISESTYISQGSKNHARKRPICSTTYFFRVHHNLQEYDHLVSEAAVFQEKKAINIKYVEHLPERENEKTLGPRAKSTVKKKKTINKV